MKKKRDNISTYYEPCNCERCGDLSDAGTLITLPLKFNINRLTGGKPRYFTQLCPECFKEFTNDETFKDCYYLKVIYL